MGAKFRPELYGNRHRLDAKRQLMYYWIDFHDLKRHAALFNECRSPAQMALHIAFEKSTDTFVKQLVKALAGPYVHVELVVSPADNTPAQAYSAYLGENFTCTPQHAFEYSDERHDFLHVPVNTDELYRVKRACETGVMSKIPYNLTDMILCQIPFRYPTEQDFYHAKTLFCSQALVLLLRACLNEEHPLQEVLHKVNSRTITPSHLYTTLRTHCQPKTLSQLTV